MRGDKKSKSKNSRPSEVGAPRLSRAQKLGIGIVAALVVFGVGFAILEAGLRSSGYGYSTSFFKKAVIEGTPVYIENTQFGFRFFPPEIARVPSPVVFPQKKAADTVRIFIFGESAALGDPEPAFGVGRFLFALLEQRFPGAKFEVIPAAMTAVNSHALLPIAHECARLDGDVWIIYAGNNEFVGPFGAGTVFGPKAPPRAIVRANLALKATRTGQLIENLQRKISGQNAASNEWGSLQMFAKNQVPPDDPRKERVYKNFQGNLEDILAIGKKSGAKVIVSSMVVNLKDCSPFASAHGYRPEAQVSFEQAWEEGMRAEASTNLDLAALKFAAALQIDPDNADAHFRLGRVYLARGQETTALKDLALARDDDALAFRADSRINQIIHESATVSGSTFVDAATELQSATRIPGEEILYEHVHLNFDGNYRLAKIFAEQVTSSLPDSRKQNDRKTWAGFEDCTRWLALTDWDERRVYEEVLRRLAQPPFTAQLNHTNQVNFLRQKWTETRTRMTPERFAEAKQTYDMAIKRSASDFYLRGNYAKLLEDNNDPRGAIAQWDQVAKLLPHEPAAYLYRGKLLAQVNDGDAALASLARALQIRPDLVEAMDEQSKIFLRKGKPNEALAILEKMARLRPNNSRVCVGMAEALARLDRRPEAVRQLERAIELQPGNWEARYLLGVELATQNKIEQAKAQFQQVALLRPDYALAHLNLGVALAKEQHLREAVAEFQQTLRLDPTNARAKDFLNQLGANAR